MSKIYKIIFPIVLVLGIVLAAVLYLHGKDLAVLQPAGEVGQKERNLMYFALGLSVIVVVPVFLLTIFIALKYRESNHQNPNRKVKYNPDWDSSRLFESIWWGIPIIIIGILSVVAWNSAHDMDPYKPLSSTTKDSLNVQVVAMDWKWLFIYPEQHIASVNMVQFPVDQPVDFHVTSDTIMNSFWIPQLGGQIYAMPGMVTQLHLIANRTGNFYGTPANIAGHGFSRMTFTAKASSQQDFDKWVQNARLTGNPLTQAAYNGLAKPSEDNPVVYYSDVQPDLYDNLVMKYMRPMNTDTNTAQSQPKATSTNHADMEGMRM